MAWEELNRTTSEDGVVEVTSKMRVTEGVLFKISTSWTTTLERQAGISSALTFMPLEEQTKNLRPQIRRRSMTRQQ